MRAVAAKEQNPGQPLAESERELHDRDWKAFSRSRGYSEDDITEYEHWLVLSGQRDDLPYAINDPWRRKNMTPSGQQEWAMSLYIKHGRAS